MNVGEIKESTTFPNQCSNVINEIYLTYKSMNLLQQKFGKFSSIVRFYSKLGKCTNQY